MAKNCDGVVLSAVWQGSAQLGAAGRGDSRS